MLYPPYNTWCQLAKTNVRNFIRHGLTSEVATQQAFDSLLNQESIKPQQQPWQRIWAIVQTASRDKIGIEVESLINIQHELEQLSVEHDDAALKPF